MKIRNYTPHTITLAGDTRTVLPSEGIARVDGLPLGPVVGLPNPRPGTLYVVSVIVAERLPERDDLRVPGEQIRDEQGRIIGCRSLLRPERASPALALLHEMPEVMWARMMRRAGATTLTVPQCMGGEYGTAVASRPGDGGSVEGGKHIVIGTVHVETHECPLAPGLLCWITLRDAWRGTVVHPKDPRPLEFIEIPKPPTARN